MSNNLRARYRSLVFFASLVLVSFACPAAIAQTTTNPNAFITTWVTTEPNQTITIPTNGAYAYDYTVNWGDGDETTDNMGDATHEYAATNTYTIIITGNFPAIRLAGSSLVNRSLIRTIEQWGTIAWQSMEGSFVDASNLNISAGAGIPNLSSVTSTRSMFRGATSFNQSINDWDVSLVTDMSRMFENAQAFNQPLNAWNVSSVTDMRDMFNGATAFDQDLGAWDVSSVSNMEDMFNGVTLSSDNYDALLSGWGRIEGDEMALQLGVNFNAGFSQYCNQREKDILASVPWTITDGGRRIAGCTPNPSAFVTTWEVNARQTITIPTNNKFTYDYTVDWGDGSSLAEYAGDASHTYTNANTYTVAITGTFPTIYFNGSSHGMSIRTIEQWGDIAWQSMEDSFRGVSNLNISAGAGSPNLSSVTSTKSMFQDATNFNSPIGHWDVSLVSDMSNMFNGATEFDQDLGAWDVSSVSDMSNMFNGATEFDQDLGAWDVSSVSDMSNMFNGATEFDYDLGAWNVSLVSDMSDMFRGVTLSSDNYDALLSGWGRIEGDEMELQQDVNFNAGDSQYCNQGAKDILDDAPNDWEITDGGRRIAGCTPDPSAFVTTWELNAEDILTIPTNSDYTYAYTVDWGDGSSLAEYTSNASHTYTVAGTYTVAITGTFPHLNYSDSNIEPPLLPLCTINQWGDIKWRSMAGSFGTCADLVITPGADSPDLSEATDMSRMFLNATNFNSPIGHWDVSNVTNMARMFQGVSRFNQNLGNWDVGNVTNMARMFEGVTLPRQNYDALLAGWSQLDDLQEGVVFDAGDNSQYCNQDAKDILEDDVLNDWDITDGGLSANCHLPAGAFVTTWITTGSNQTITIPTNNNSFKYSYTVNWGDGNTDNTIYTGNATHEYAAANTYTVAITGTFPAIYFFDSNEEDRNSIRTVEQWGDTFWESMEGSFRSVSNLSISANAGILKLSPRISMRSMFWGATNFNSPIGHWDVSSVEDMTQMFRGTSFNQPLGDWDVSNVNDMEQMFRDTSAFNQPLNNWEVGSVTDMTQMFRGALAFNQPLGSWDVRNVQNMNWMFLGASAFDQNLGSWDVGNVTAMPRMFRGVRLSLQNYDALLAGWSQIPLQQGVEFDAGSSQYCDYEARNILILNNWDITDGGLFANCPLPADAFGTTWITTGSNQTITIPTNDNFTYNYTVNWGDGTDISEYDGDAMHTYDNAGTYTVAINGTFPAIYFFDSNEEDRNRIRTIEQWGDIVWQSMEGSFSSVPNLSISPDAGSPDLSSVSSMLEMFRSATNFNSPIGHWDVSNVANMSRMFQSTRFNQPLSGWNVSNVIDMTAMFINNSAFNQPLGNWDVSNVQDMNSMFTSAFAFDQNLGNWDVGKVRDMNRMFLNISLSRLNYDALLAGWAQIEDGETPLRQGVQFSAGNSEYCNYLARYILRSNSNWMITDGGRAANCSAPPTSAFVTTWRTTGPDQTITIPINNNLTYDYIVDWGDGTEISEHDGDATHTYDNAGTYTVAINGTFPAIYFTGSSTNNRNRIRTIEQWGDIVWQSMEGSFISASNLLSISDDAGSPDLSSVTSMRSMFRRATNFNSPIGHWDVSSVEDMTLMFNSAEAFNQPHWVTGMLVTSTT